MCAKSPWAASCARSVLPSVTTQVAGGSCPILFLLSRFVPSCMQTPETSQAQPCCAILLIYLTIVGGKPNRAYKTN